MEINNSNLISEDEDLIRKLKINVPKKYYQKLILKLFKKAKQHNMDIFVKCSFVYNELEIDIYNPGNKKFIDAYNFIDNIHSKILKYKGNIFSKL